MGLSLSWFKFLKFGRFSEILKIKYSWKHSKNSENSGKYSGQNPEETAQCSTKLIQLNYSYLKSLKLKVNSLFGHTFLCPYSHLCFESPFLSQSKIPSFCCWFLWKALWTNERSKMASFCKTTRLSSEEALLQK